MTRVGIRSRLRLLLAVVLVVAGLALPASSLADISRPSGWGAHQGRCCIWGPPNQFPSRAQYFPFYNGSGYSIYVCRAAREVGYTTGRLNHALGFGSTINDGRKANFEVSDTCDNLQSGTFGSIITRRQPNDPFFFYNRDASGAGGDSISWSLGVGGSLSIRHWSGDTVLNNYRTRVNQRGPYAVVADLFHITAGGKPVHHSCTSLGRWGVPPASSSASYPGGAWRNGNADYPVQDSSSAGGAPLGSVWNSMFYRWNPAGYGAPWAVHQRSNGAGATNPQSQCMLEGGPRGVYYGNNGPRDLSFTWVCAGPPGRYRGCRGTAGGPSDEPPATDALGQGNRWIEVRSLEVFVQDYTPPSIRFDPPDPGKGPLDLSGGIAGSGNTNRTLEQLKWSTTDDAGIRRQTARFYNVATPTVDIWSVDQDFNSICDHRYRVPCPLGANPWSVNTRPPTGGSSMVQMYERDVDPLPRGIYEIQIRAQDGSGRWATRTARFEIATARRQDDCVDGGATPMNSGSDEVMRSGVYGTDLVTVQDERCAGTTFTDPVPTTPTESAPTPGAVVALPAPGTGYFSYTLAANAQPTATPLNPAQCQMREHVVNGASGGSLSPRELNQIVAITIDLTSFVKEGGSSGQGGQLGEHNLRTTFDFPSRATQRYRSALGCPSDAPPTP